MSNLLKSRLSISALKERAGDIASEELLSKISGGTANACHDDNNDPCDGSNDPRCETVKVCTFNA